MWEARLASLANLSAEAGVQTLIQNFLVMSIRIHTIRSMLSTVTPPA